MENNEILKDSKGRVAVTYVPVTNLKELDGNPRIWSEFEKKNLKESLKKFSILDPLIVNSAPGQENVVLSGNFRLAMLHELGVKEAPCIFVHIEDKNRAMELALRMNRNQGQWSFDILREFDVDLLVESGFDDIDLGQIFDDQLETEEDNFNVSEEIKKIKTPTVKPGEMYLLGKHKLLCSDSSDFEAVKRIAKDEKISVVYCDPPFNIGLDYNKGLGLKGNYGGNTNDKKSDEDYRKFIKSTIQNALSVIQPDTHFFYYCDQKYIGMFQAIYKEVGINFKRVCLWLKNNSNITPQIAFNKVYEPIIYGTVGKPYLNINVKNLNEIQNKEIGNGNRLIDDVLDLLDIWLVKRLPTSQYIHPTEKPVTLHEKALRRCSKPGDTVLDLFSGSGSLMLSCEQLKRKSLSVEVEPIFCDLIIKRYEQYSGEKTVRIG